MQFYFNKQHGNPGVIIDSRRFELFVSIARYLLKVVQQADEGDEVNKESSIAYLSSTAAPPTTVINLDDYCRLFECRSQL